jgi:hypothetical protein
VIGNLAQELGTPPVEILEYRGKDYLKLNVQLKTLLGRVDDEQARVEIMQAALLEPLKWYCPNGKQEEFIDTIVDRMGKSRTPTILLSAANGIGKTNGSIHVLGNIVYGAQNGWFLSEPFLSWQNPKIAWYITTKTGLTDVVIPEIKRVFPPGTYTFDKMGATVERAIHFDNGWELRFFTMDVGADQMESASVGLIIIDEPAPESIWKAAKSRGRMGCLTLLPMTPLDVEPYILDEIERNKNDKLYGKVVASVYDACAKRGIRGHLDPQIIDEMVEKYPADERVARVDGQFMYFREQIWTGLDKAIHFVDPHDYPVNFGVDYIVQAVDPHDSRPTACIYGALQLVDHSDGYKQLIRDGRAFQQIRRIIFLETPERKDQPYWEMYRDVRLDEEPEMWSRLEDSYGIQTVHRRVIDKRYGFQTKLSSNIAAVFAAAGGSLDPVFHGNKRFVYEPSYDLKSVDNDGLGELAYGHNLVNKCLDLLEDGKPGLVVWNSCYHLKNGMTHYVRKRLNSRGGSEIAAGETKIIEKYKDFNDVLRYFAAVDLSMDYLSYRTNKQEDEVARRNRSASRNSNNNGTRNIYKVMGRFMKKAR